MHLTDVIILMKLLNCIPLKQQKGLVFFKTGNSVNSLDMYVQNVFDCLHKLQLKKLNLKDSSFDDRQMHLWPVGREEAAKVQLNKNVLTQGFLRPDA